MAEISPPPEISAKLVEAIQGALREEKAPRLTRWLKIASGSVICTALMALPILFMLKEQATLVWKCALVIWGSCFALAFWLYFRPQPRLVVPGYWSPFIFAKILLAMTALTGAQILLCPSFVFLDTPVRWNPFLPVTEWLMAIGGMSVCMASCGFLFSGIGGIVAFGLIRQTLRRSHWEDILKASGVAYFTQIPIVLIQIFDPALRAFATSWMLGGIVGTISIAAGVRAMSKR